MAVTQIINPKGMVKKFSNSDIPVSLSQPVIGSYYTTSTASQTVINLSFSIVASGANANTDIFWLFVDGKKLNLGSTNDYTFTSIGADGTSSQVTLNYSIIAGLNVQAFKLGLKKEVEFQTDNRFTQLYNAMGEGFQGFISESARLVATTTTGTPAAGYFYSTIQNRPNIPDLTQDFKVRMGVERIMTQSIMQSNDEYGPNGESVFEVVNDDKGLIRFVGAGWYLSNSTNGLELGTTNINDYVEVTFYGTGLNLLGLCAAGAGDLRVSVDGGAESANLYTNGSSILTVRNYSPNQIMPMVNALTLGIHTVKLRVNAGPGAVGVYGFEILNESSQIKENPGVAYIQGKKVTKNVQDSEAYNTNFTNIHGTPGTVGGRVLVYTDQSGTTKKDIQYVNTAPAYLTSTDHTNEEIARIHNWREFGVGRADDFSANFAQNSSLAFTLDDGITTLMGDAVSWQIYNNSNILQCYTVNNFFTLTFVGSGVDILENDSVSVIDQHTFYIDGVSIGATTAGLNGKRQIASGLPYGTHTLKIVRNVTAVAALQVTAFIVYQPKKPNLPSGCIELADYNIMANYVVSASSALGVVSNGILRKALSVREAIYTGTWGISLDPTVTETGISTNSTTTSSTISYTFIGTGFEWRGEAYISQVQNATLSVDGSTNLSGFTTSLVQTGSGVTFTPATGVLAGTNAASVNRLLIQVSGLTYGKHTITWTTGNTNNFYVDAFDIITPIHSTKSNLNADMQNTLPVGSCSISDNRTFTAIKENYLQKKNWAQAFGITSSPTTTVSSANAVPCPDMSVTHKNISGRIKISCCVSLSGGTLGGIVMFYIDGVKSSPFYVSGTTSEINLSPSMITNISPGVHKIDVYWSINSAGTVTSVGTNRTLTVEEI